jgi:hypothetical protein
MKKPQKRRFSYEKWPKIPKITIFPIKTPQKRNFSYEKPSKSPPKHHFSYGKPSKTPFFYEKWPKKRIALVLILVRGRFFRFWDFIWPRFVIFWFFHIKMSYFGVIFVFLYENIMLFLAFFHMKIFGQIRLYILIFHPFSLIFRPFLLIFRPFSFKFHSFSPIFRPFSFNFHPFSPIFRPFSLIFHL